MIAFDAASSGSTTGTVLTVSHTVGSGHSRILLVSHGARSNSNTVTSITYAGISMHLVDQQLPVSGWQRLYYLVNPPVGTHDIVSTIDQSINHVQASASYRGVNQTSPFDVVDKSHDDTGTVNTLSQSLITTIDNDWIVASGIDNTQVQTAHSGSTQRAASGGNMRNGFYDNNGPLTPVGTYSIGFDLAAPQTCGIIAAALVPAAPLYTPVLCLI